MVDEDSKLHGLLAGLAKIKTSYWELLIGVVIGLVLGLLVIGNMSAILEIFILLLQGITVLRLLPKSETSTRGKSDLELHSPSSSGGSGKLGERIWHHTPCPECGSLTRHSKKCSKYKPKEAIPT